MRKSASGWLRLGEHPDEPPQHQLETPLRVLRRELRHGRLVADEERQGRDEVHHEPSVRLQRLTQRARQPSNQTPSQVAPAYDSVNDASAAPALLDSKAMRSVGELGHIFHPAQAADDLRAPTSSELPYNNKISGGGRTLRIGQPEFRSDTADNWNTNGRRAIELLDLFTVNGTNIDSQGYPAAIGRINPNTAVPEILAAVLSGIQISSDRGIPASSLSDTAAIAANIVSNRPYSVLSDSIR